MTVRPPPPMFYGPPLFSFYQRVLAAGSEGDLTPTSWYRSPIENARVGGDPFSQHQLGWALDVVGPDATGFAKRARLTGLTAVVESDHVHIQLFPAGIVRLLLGSG